MVVVLLANGFEELEALTPVDVLRRNNIDVRTVSITNEKLITGTHGIQVAADLIASDVPLSEIDMLILPGGMPGVKNLDASPITKIFIDATLKNGGRLAAICAAPSIFGRHGMLTNIKATCFPGFEGELLNAILTDADVVTDGVFTTAKDYEAASKFAKELVRVCDKLGIKPHDENEEPEEEEDTLEFDFTDSDDEELDIDALLAKLTEACDDESEDEPEANGLEIVSALALTDEDLSDAQKTADRITAILASFGVKATVDRAERGPRFTRYSVTPAKGVRVNYVTNLFGDIALSIGREGIRMEAPIPGTGAIGIEIPNKTPTVVKFSELAESECFASATSKTTVTIGTDIAGNPVFGDIAKMPHALVCGATGMGKSVFINTILSSLIYKSTPDEARFILIDPKQVEFRMYNNLPHLLTPVVTDAKEAAGALKWAVEEMEHRYGLIEKANVRNLDAYNEKAKADPTLGKPLPKIVIVIDELADLMMQVRNPIENLIVRIAQKARAAGIHLIIGTQRPSVQVLTGVIKANIPTRICFKVATQVDSRTVLDLPGAEKLLNRGDMLYWPVELSKAIRVQGAFISDSDVERLVGEMAEKYTAQVCEEVAEYISEFKANFRSTAKPARDEFADDETDDDDLASYLLDDNFLVAVDVAIAAGSASTSLIQRKLSIGYGKAARYIDAMEKLGIVSEPRGQKPREVLVSADEWKKIR